MNPIIPPNYANAIAPFSPLGRRPVGEEDADLKRRGSTLKALEESAGSAPGENRRSPDERAGEAGEKVRLSQSGLDQLNKQKASAVKHRVREQSQGSNPIDPAAGTQVEAGQLEAELRAELVRQQARKLLQSLRALRAMNRDVEIVGTGTDGLDAATQKQVAKAHADQRALIQNQIDLSRRLIDMGIDAEPTPLGHRFSQRI